MIKIKWDGAGPLEKNVGMTNSGIVGAANRVRPEVRVEKEEKQRPTHFTFALLPSPSHRPSISDIYGKHTPQLSVP